MKTVLSFFLCFFYVSFPGFSTENNKERIAFPQGIYKTLDAFKQQTPSSCINQALYTKDIRLGFWGLGKQHIEFKRLHSSYREARKTGHIFAIADSAHVYIKTNRQKLHKNSNFAEADMEGNYAFFQDIQYHVDSRLPFLWYSNSIEKFTNLMTGKTKALTVFNVKKIIRNNTALYAQFKADKSKRKHLKEYLLN